MTVCGEYLAPGTIVGMSAWVTHRDQETFGKDADVWRPERWLVEAETRKRMESGLLTVRSLHLLSPFIANSSCARPSQFGAGHRTCLGKNISHLEIYKLVPTVLQVYDVSSDLLFSWTLVATNTICFCYTDRALEKLTSLAR